MPSGTTRQTRFPSRSAALNASWTNRFTSSGASRSPTPPIMRAGVGLPGSVPWEAGLAVGRIVVIWALCNPRGRLARKFQVQGGIPATDGHWTRDLAQDEVCPICPGSAVRCSVSQRRRSDSYTSAWATSTALTRPGTQRTPRMDLPGELPHSLVADLIQLKLSRRRTGCTP